MNAIYPAIRKNTHFDLLHDILGGKVKINKVTGIRLHESWLNPLLPTSVAKNLKTEVARIVVAKITEVDSHAMNHAWFGQLENDLFIVLGFTAARGLKA